MKKIFLFTLLIVLQLTVMSQNTLITTMDATVYVLELHRARNTVNQFLKDNQVNVIEQTENSGDVYWSCYLSAQAFADLQALLPKLGYIESNRVNTLNTSIRANELQNEIDYLLKRKAAYETELQKMGETGDRYYEYWSEIRNIDSQIFEKQTEQKRQQQKTDYEARFRIIEEGSDFSASNISWVNMPGAAVDMLFVENPADDLSAKMYMGYSLKYLITRGKSYFTLGAMKEFNSTMSYQATRYTELFHFGFGQDWYTRYFGRGKNRFLNLYTGYNFGGLFATSDVRNRTIFYGNLFLGIELFKNKYIVIDNKAGYLVPFAHNRNLRGITYNASFNFVF